MTASLKPFAKTQGRDASKDRPAQVDISRCCYDRRGGMAEDGPILRQVIAAVGWSNDLGSPQWAQWYSLALGFAPDVIVELGRGRGNSTALFTQAAGRLGRTKVVSVCRSHDWW